LNLYHLGVTDCRQEELEERRKEEEFKRIYACKLMVILGVKVYAKLCQAICSSGFYQYIILGYIGDVLFLWVDLKDDLQ
jgi:hypothetical protein